MIHSRETPSSRFIRNVRRIRRLTRSEEEALCILWYEHGDVAARDEIVLRYLRLVTAMAVGYRHYGIEIDELIGEGQMGLIHALGKFDHTRGLRLLTYAQWWIRAYMLRYVLRTHSIVGSGLRSSEFFKQRRRYTVLRNQMDAEDACRILAEEFGVPVAAMKAKLARTSNRDVSLDEPAFEHGEFGPTTPRRDNLTDDTPTPEEAAIDSERRRRVKAKVAEMLSCLDPRERTIVEKRLMSDDPPRLQDIGDIYGVSRERIRQLEAGALKKMRHRVTAEEVEL